MTWSHNVRSGWFWRWEYDGPREVLWPAIGWVVAFAAIVSKRRAVGAPLLLVFGIPLAAFLLRGYLRARRDAAGGALAAVRAPGSGPRSPPRVSRAPRPARRRAWRSNGRTRREKRREGAGRLTRCIRDRPHASPRLGPSQRRRGATKQLTRSRHET
jgi:hypothetical protein